MIPLSMNHICYRNDNTYFNLAKNQFIKLWVSSWFFRKCQQFLREDQCFNGLIRQKYFCGQCVLLTQSQSYKRLEIKCKNFLISRRSIEERLLIINLFGVFYGFKYVPIHKKEHRHYRKNYNGLVVVKSAIHHDQVNTSN